MPNTLQDFLAASTQQVATDLVAALLSIPEDKRNWSPGAKARTALDMVAECALNNGYTADLVETRQWTMNDHDAYLREKVALAAGSWEALHTLLQDNTQKVIAIIRAVPDEMLGVEVPTPYSTGPLSGIMVYPYWNMSYHLGQINYIASILDGSE